MNEIIIHADRLILKSISMEHRDDIFSEFTNEVAVYMYPQPAKDISEIENFIKESMAGNKEGSNFQMVVLKKDIKEFLGCAGIHKIDTKKPELGIWIKKSAQGKKYGLEAVTALKNWADENLDYDYLLYPVVKTNMASRKIPETLGGVVTREFTSKNVKGKIMHQVEYRIYKNSK